jgi:hypothetical protein
MESPPFDDAGFYRFSALPSSTSYRFAGRFG